MLSRRGLNEMNRKSGVFRRRMEWAAGSCCLLLVAAGCDPGRSSAPPQASFEAPVLETIAAVDDGGGEHHVQVNLDESGSAAARSTDAAEVPATPPPSATTLVAEQETEPAQVAAGAQADAELEQIPAPFPQKEVVAESVPAPRGTPENRGDRGETEDMAGLGHRVSSPPSGAVPSLPQVPPVKPASERQGGLGNPEAFGLPESDSISLDVGAESADSLPKTPSVQVGGNRDGGLASNEQTSSDPPPDYRQWPVPDLTLFVTGQQHGYIEPCGCTGLENQKGGAARRMTMAKQLRDRGWPLVPVDAGNLVRRFGKQADIKYHRSLEALRTMGYAAVGFGPDDVRLGVGELILEAADDGNPKHSIYASANVVLLDESLMPNHQMVSRNGMRVGITSILDPASLEGPVSDEIVIRPIAESARTALKAIRAKDPSFTVLTFYGDEDTAKQLVREVPGFDLIVVAGGYGEPTFRPVDIEGSETRMILTGDKGMYVGLVGLYADEPMRYARVALTHEFKDAAEMRQLMAEYQEQLKQLGLKGLGLEPIPHPSGNQFVGTATCGECHTTAFDIWEGSMHAEATEHLVHPGERSDVARHFDPECLSCHVTGWNPQNYYPYASGYLDLQQSDHLHGNGCENCHGPGSAHVKAEEAPGTVSEEKRDELRLAMRLPLDQARETCMKCHDLDNSPDFHEEDAFDDYWAEIEHYGLD